jgi:glucose/arabinose dehydrogenase
MNVVSADGKQISKIEGFPKVDSKGQGGMLDVALDPDFKTNNIIYFSFSEPYEKEIYFCCKRKTFSGFKNDF